ncbi:MAG: glycosyltransferase family 9 protein [Fidelibacterota bacterium]|nr:MAG: glycosyltransferase family 9 protein [Candidatus Neomarinimicrobiota bacterium]
MTSVLVIRFSSVGDIILSAPVIKALHLSEPEINIDYLVHERFSALVRHFDPPPHSVIPFPPTTKAGQLAAYARNLAARNYDVVIDLHNSLRSKYIRRFFRSSEVRVYHKPRIKRSLLFYLWINLFSSDFSVIKEYLRYAGFSASDQTDAPRLAVADSEAETICQQFGLGNDYMISIPGAAWPQKSWLAGRYSELFSRIFTQYDGQLVLLGGNQDGICDLIAGNLTSERVVNLKGKTDLDEALAVLSRGRLIIGSDTGLVHAGEALGIPAIMMLGPTSRETGARVHHPHSQALEVALWCRPCSQNGKRRCYRKEQYCMTRIAVEDVYKIASRFYEGN